MSVIDIGSAWANGDQLTPAALNAKWTGATFNTSAVDASSTALSGGAIIVKDLGITEGKIAALAVTNGKIGANAVTASKMATTQDWSTFTITLPVDSVVTATITDDMVTFVKLATADNATQANMEAETASKRVTPDVVINHPGVAKAYGTVAMSSGDSTLTSEFNATVHATGTGTRTIQIPAMDGTEYVIQATYDSPSIPGSSVPIATVVSATTFTIRGDEASNRFVHFTVFGNLA